MNAFCNTDDITWGTKNLDTKKDVSQAKGLLKSSMAYSGPQNKESKSFWAAMMKVREMCAHQLVERRGGEGDVLISPICLSALPPHRSMRS